MQIVSIKNIQSFYNDPRVRKFFWLAVFLVLFILYFFYIRKTLDYFLSTFKENFGYWDTQDNWTALDDFVKGRVFFKDYFYEYGWFILLLEAIPYILLKQTYFAMLVGRHFFLPIVSVTIAFFVGKFTLRKKYLIFLFLLLNLFYGATTDYSPIRHIMVELSLSVFILYLYNPRPRFAFIAGVIGGLGVLTALEYGLALNATVFCILLLSFIPLKSLKIPKVFFPRFFLGEALILFPFFLYLQMEGALKNYFMFVLSYMNNFYYMSPCARESFPRLEDIEILRKTSPLLLGNIPIEFLQNLNLYLVPVVYVLTFIVVLIRVMFLKSDSKRSIVMVSLSIFGSLVYIRTLDTPCIGYFRYGLVPFFLLLLTYVDLLITYKKHFYFRFIMALFSALIISWFLLTEHTGTIVRWFGKKIEVIPSKQQSKVYYAQAGWYMEERFTTAYKDLTNYIIQRTTSRDYVYVYPWGPYNQLTGLRHPNAVTTGTAPLGGKFYIHMLINDLKQHNPKYVVVNVYNNLAIAVYGTERKDGPRYYSLHGQEGPVFSGEGNPIETYILQNYKPVYSNIVGVVMERRQKPVQLGQVLHKVATVDLSKSKNIQLKCMNEVSKQTYKITDPNAVWQTTLDNTVPTDDLEITFKVDGDLLTKRFSRYIATITALSQNGEVLNSVKILVNKELQTERLILDTRGEVKKVRLEFTKNNGFIPWFHPQSFTIKDISFYQWDLSNSPPHAP
jgi:hypothetical protein